MKAPSRTLRNSRGQWAGREPGCYFCVGRDPQPGEEICQPCHEKLVQFFDWLERQVGRR